MRLSRCGAWLFPLLVVTAPTAALADDDDDILAPAEEAPKAKEAAPAKKVGVVPFLAVGDASKPLAEQVTTRLTKELTDAKLTLSPLALATASGEGSAGNSASGEKDLAAAKKELEKAEKLLKAMQFGKAERLFQNTIGLFGKAAPAVDDVAPLVSAHLGLAEVYARQGMEDETGEALTDAARLNPEHVLDSKRYPPQFVRSFAKFRDRMLAGPKGTIFVDESARGAQIRIGAKEVGTAPLRITDVPEGAHFVRLTLPGVGTYGARVEVTAAEEATVSGGFFTSGGTSPEDVLATNALNDDAVAQIARAAKAAGVDLALVGVVAKKRSTVPVGLVAVSPDGGAKRLPVLDLDGDLLNLTIEALKAREGMLGALADKSFGPVGDAPLLEDVKIGVVEIASVALRYEAAGAAVSEAPRSRRTSGRVASAEAGDDDDEGGRRILEGGKGGRRKSLREGEEERITFREPRQELVEDPDEGGLFSSPWLWVGVGTGAAVVLAVAGTAGAAAGWYFLVPPTTAEVSVALPE